MLFKYHIPAIAALLLPRALVTGLNGHPAWGEESAESGDDAIEARGQHGLQKRISTGFSLEQTLVNETLFDGNSAVLALLPVGAPPVTVVCASCCTRGTVNASLTDANVTDPVIRFDMAGVEAFVELDVTASGGHTFGVPLFRQPPSPLGISIPGGPNLGLTFQVDLVFDIEAAVDLHGGFFLRLPDDAFFEASLTNGTLGNISFDGIASKSLPLTVNNGTSAKFQVDLQFKAQIGIDLTSSLLSDLFSHQVGAALDVGVYVNLAEFVATLDETDDCLLQAEEIVDLNAGAFLGADVNIDGRTLGVVPTASTTLFQAAFGTQCLVSHGQAMPTRSAAVAAAAATPAPSVCVANGTTATLPAPTAVGLGNNSSTTGVQNSTATTLPALFTTDVLTITSCGAAVVNCPPSLQSIIEVTRTLCANPQTTTTATAAAATGTCSFVTDAPAMSSLATPIVGTFAPAGGNNSINANATSSITLHWNLTSSASAAFSTAAATTTTSEAGNGLLQVPTNTTTSTTAAPTPPPPSAAATTTTRSAAGRVGEWCGLAGAGLALAVFLAL